MQNFKNTEYENMTEEEIYLSNEKLVRATIRRKYPNYKAYCQVHMIELEDLVQQGSLGLLNAIRTFDSSKDSSFRSYAINRIAWSISDNTRKESLRTFNTRSSETVNIVSVDTQLQGQDEEVTILDTIESNSNTSDEAEDNLLIKKVIELLENDNEVDSDMLYILVARMKGDSMQSIANHFGCHRNSIIQKLKTNKAMRIKARIKAHLENGDY